MPSRKGKEKRTIVGKLSRLPVTQEVKVRANSRARQ
jgi:hypothetical protein